MGAAVFSELRLLSSADLDSRSILTVILAGDSRLSARLESLDLLPLASRIRSRLRTESLPPQQLLQCLEHLLAGAGNPKLMPPNLLRTLSEHAAGNLRLLMNLGNDLLAAALRQERDHLDEKLFFEVFTPDPRTRSKRS
jgi:type II secretory pathway predicted ATPase ExeA